MVEQRGRARWLRLNRPRQRNALNAGLISALDQQITLAETDTNTAVVVVSANGPSFCAGGDFRDFLASHAQGRNPVEFLTDVSACFSRIEASPVPWVAVLHGHVVAGGLELALVCDVVIAADTALIGDGHVNNRLTPAGGSSVRLPTAVGRGLARRLLLTGELLPARDFANSGWIHSIVPESDLDAEAMRIADILADAYSPTQREIKALLHQIQGLPPEAALRAELSAFAENWSTNSVAETLQRFLDNRPQKH
nr:MULTISPECIES: enoyl-CoA hydratase/isomerase family protein [unclassified Mycolicibacterium]